MQARHPAGQRHRTLLAALQPPARRQRATAAPQRTSCCSKPLRCHCRRRWAGRLAHRSVRKMKHLVPTFAVHGPRCNCYRLRMIVSKKKLTCVLHGRSRIVQALPQQRRQQPQHLLLHQTLVWHHCRQSLQQQQPHPPRCRQHNRQTPGPQPPVNSSLLQAASWQFWTRCLPLRRCDSRRPPVMCEPVATCSPRAICGLAAGVSWCASDTILSRQAIISGGNGVALLQHAGMDEATAQLIAASMQQNPLNLPELSTTVQSAGQPGDDRACAPCCLCAASSISQHRMTILQGFSVACLDR